jgi:branched-chain amino acid transport system ATP-binding protein
MLEVKGLSKHFEGVKAVQNCSFKVGKNELVALIGPNGAGKTTVFSIVTGLEQPDSGTIRFKDRPITGMKTHAIANLGIGRTFQLIRLFPRMTVMDNMLLAKKDPMEGLFNSLVRSSKKHRKAMEGRCFEFLKLVGLEGKRESLAHDLSYGQQKLLEIARALATEADLLMLDEPVAGVNPKLRDRIGKMLLDLKKSGKTILFIEHDMKFVMDIADRIIVMDGGKNVAEGNAKQIKKDPNVMKAYLGG